MDHQYLRVAVMMVPPRKFWFFLHSLDNINYTINYIFRFRLSYSAYKIYHDPNSLHRRSWQRERWGWPSALMLTASNSTPPATPATKPISDALSSCITGLINIYSDSKNWFTFGKFFLARPIVAQITKLNSWEFFITNQSIMVLFVPNVKTLASCIDLIQDLQWPPLNEPVFVLVASFPFFGLNHCLHPPGHTLN